MEVSGLLLKILIWGLLLKLGFAMVRIWLDFDLYEGTADAARYINSGTIIAQHIWRLEFDQLVPYLQRGTDFIEFLTGTIFSVIGPTRIGGYLVYASFAFLGSYFFYKAFRVAFPQGNKQLYVILIFFFPSIIFWPNGIGKDALIFLCIGLSAYGSAILLSQGRLQGLMVFALGLLGTMYIRPHVAAILVFALILAFLVQGVSRKSFRPVTFVTGLLTIGGLIWFLLPRVTDFLGLQGLSAAQILGYLEQRQELTYLGGSAFEAIDISNPLSIPMAIITVFFRPFPWEANNLQAVIQSLEGIMLMGVILWRLKSLGKAAVSLISNAYLLFIIIYIIAFVFAFVSVQNFGLLARQRTMMFPLFFMLLAYVPFHTRTEGRVPEIAI